SSFGGAAIGGHLVIEALPRSGVSRARRPPRGVVVPVPSSNGGARAAVRGPRGGPPDGPCSRGSTEEGGVPGERTMGGAPREERLGKSPGTKAGEFVGEEMKHIRGGKHGARSTEQAIAIGLSKARRAGVALPPPPPGHATEGTRRRAARDYREGQAGKKKPPSRRRARATLRALRREPRTAASRRA